MRRNSTRPLGALHPILFFIFIYGISLFLAIFVCRTVYFSLNDTADSSQSMVKADMPAAAIMNATALK